MILYRLFQIRNVRFLRRKVVDKAATPVLSKVSIQPSISAAALPLHTQLGPQEEHFLASLSRSLADTQCGELLLLFLVRSHTLAGTAVRRQFALTFNF